MGPYWEESQSWYKFSFLSVGLRKRRLLDFLYKPVKRSKITPRNFVLRRQFLKKCNYVRFKKMQGGEGFTIN